MTGDFTEDETQWFRGDLLTTSLDSGRLTDEIAVVMIITRSINSLKWYIKIMFHMCICAFLLKRFSWHSQSSP